ncbi:MAG: class I SAM-dependent methyltransferase [Dehalococcoidia bacterium]|nr:class I SAM-dependent methyltransferase [Dehalococcoidia bacterium]
MRKDIHETNRLSWNLATAAHNSHKGDQAKFLREGGSTLFPEDLEMLGDIVGKRVVHLQCNAGPDSLSLAALGAIVTGVDISDEAIDYARRLSADSRIPAEFVRSDVYDWFDEAIARGDQFDRVFVSYGALIWLSDIRGWAEGVAGVLAPGGAIGLVEFHPVGLMYNEKGERDWPYFSHGEPQSDGEGIGDYVAFSGDGLVPWGYEEGVTGFVNPIPSSEFLWGIGDVVTALIDAGLVLETLREYPYSNGTPRMVDSVEGAGRRFYVPEGQPNLPQLYALRARKPA